MPRQKAPALRRQKLIEATLAAINRYGFSDTTVSRVAAIAGVSAGNVHRYFGGKSGLLEEAMRALLRGLRQESVERLDRAQSGWDRLDAVIAANFGDALFTPAICRTWLHFWAEAPHAPALARLEALNHRRIRSNMVAALRLLMPAAAARPLARMLVATIDGLWVHRAQKGAGLEPAAARRLLRLQIAALLAEQGVVAPPGWTAKG